MQQFITFYHYYYLSIYGGIIQVWNNINWCIYNPPPIPHVNWKWFPFNFHWSNSEHVIFIFNEAIGNSHMRVHEITKKTQKSNAPKHNNWVESLFEQIFNDFNFSSNFYSNSMGLTHWILLLRYSIEIEFQYVMVLTLERVWNIVLSISWSAK